MLNSVCDALYAEGRSLWPDIALPFAAFADCVSRQGRPLVDKQAGDVYLCCACALGDPAALRAFETRYLTRIDRALAHMRLGSRDVDEVRQHVREKLFLRHGDELPKIAEYAGGGDLEGLVKVMAVRAALNLLRTRRRRREVGDEPLSFAVGKGDDPELAVLKERLRHGFREALAGAAASLSSRQRTLLRLQFVDGLTVDDIGILYRVHRATAARWVAAAKEALVRTSVAHAVQRLGLDGDALASAQRLVRSQIDLSLARILR